MKQEIIGMRTRNSKTIDNGDGTRTLQLRRHGLHYLKDGHFEDIDTTIVNGRMDKAGYRFDIVDNKITFTKDGDWIEFEVDKLQWSCDKGISIVSLFKSDVTAVVTGNEIRWDNAFGPGIHLLYGCSPDGIYKKVIVDDYIEPPLHLIDEPELLLEIVLKYRKSNINVNVDGKEEAFDTYRYVRGERVVFGDNKFEFVLPYYGDSGYKTDIGHRIITKNTIRTGVMHSFLTKALYPAFIDTDVNEQVGASTDDTNEEDDTNVSLSGTDVYFGRNYQPPYEDHSVDFGMRFTTVAVPKDATINTAVLSIYKTDSNGSIESTIWGIDEDNTLTWASDNRPSQRTKTTANIQADKADWGSFGADGDDVWITSPDISTIISEITSRASWASNNALGLVILNDLLTDVYNSIRFNTWDYAGNLYGAKLDINYTAAAAGWTGKVCGVTNPAKVCGVASANIAKVSGV